MGHSRVRGFKVWSYLFMLARIVAEEKRPSMSFLRTILGRGIRNPGSQADAEKKKSINGKPGGVPEEGVKSGAGGPHNHSRALMRTRLRSMCSGKHPLFS